MIGKEKIKFVRSLHQKKFRQKYNKFIAEGPKIVGECIAHAPDLIETIYGTLSYIQTLENQSNNLKEKLIEVSNDELRKISALDTPHEVLAILKVEEPKGLKVVEDALYLDGLQIPNNVGAILRIADWYGINNVFSSKNTADFLSPKVIQASMGSFLRLHLESIRLIDLLDRYPQHQCVVADGGGDMVSKEVFNKPSILILGSEGNGPSEISLKMASKVVAIPRYNDRLLPESLNVAVAAGIICNEWRGSISKQKGLDT